MLYPYIVVTTDSSGCESISNEFQYYLNRTNELINKEFNAFPNPANDYFTFQSQLAIKQIILYDSVGKIIVKTENNYVNISNIDNGIYFYKFCDETNKFFTGKIAVMK